MPSNTPELSEWAVRKAVERLNPTKSKRAVDEIFNAVMECSLDKCSICARYNQVAAILIEVRDEGIDTSIAKVKERRDKAAKHSEAFDEFDDLIDDLTALKSTQEVKTNG